MIFCRKGVKSTDLPIVVLVLLAPIALLVLGACRGDRHRAPEVVASALDVGASSSGAPEPMVYASPVASAEAALSAPAEPHCRAPSLSLSSELDAYGVKDLDRCVHLARGASVCGERAGLSVDVERFRASVPAFDDATTDRIVRVATLGKQRGLNPHAFGLVGDSITISGSFLYAFGSHEPGDISVDPVVAPLLARSDGTSIIDYYRAHEVERFAGKPLDSFDAERAAKVGARASFPTIGGDASPLDSLVTHVKPAIAVVTFGANDATYRTAPPDELADEFEKNLLELISRLEARGVVVVLENEMRHGDQPGVKACPSDDERANDWRTAITTNAIIRRTDEIACREHLPFVDLRYALDGATAYGLGPDAVHLSTKKRSPAHLDAKALDCGYSIRGLVTLMALRDVVDALERRGVF